MGSATSKTTYSDASGYSSSSFATQMLDSTLASASIYFFGADYFFPLVFFGTIIFVIVYKNT